MAKLLCNLGVVHLYPNFSFLLLLIVFRFKIHKRCLICEEYHDEQNMQKIKHFCCPQSLL